MTRTPLLRVLLWLALAPATARALDFEFKAPASADDPAVPQQIRDLAERMLPVYQDPDSERYLANLSSLQLADSNYAAADDARQSLRERQKGKAVSNDEANGSAVAMDLYAHARTVAAAGSAPLPQAFAQAFRDTVPKLGDREAHAVTDWLSAPMPLRRDALQAAFDRSRGQQRLEQAQAFELISTYLALEAQRSIGATAAALAAEDAARRYYSPGEVLIRGAGGSDIHIRVVLPKGTAVKRTALLEYSLAPPIDDARDCAAHGYAGVIAYSRERGGSMGVAPFVHEGEDARAVIRWIARQKWSDGRVGLYGDGYGGYAAWAAARQPPVQLKAIATADAMVPGISFPAPGRVFRNASYPWALAAQSGDGSSDLDAAQWQALQQKWYRGRAPYRALDQIARQHNQTFQQWLDHPSYDRWWQKLTPQGKQFARIGIPVLGVAGYYSDGALGERWYLEQHQRYRAKAEHSLLLGPWDGNAPRAGPTAILGGGHALLDPAAVLDLGELRLRWFDHVFRNTPLPPPLADRVSYQLAGGNEWRHAPSLAAMSNGALRLYLDPAGSGARHRLSEAAPPDSAFTSQVIDFADRRDAAWTPPPAISGGTLPLHEGLTFTGEPLPQALELGGALSGRLDFMLNRMDVDLSLTLYEQSADGSLLQLAAPWEFRASYAGDPAHRRLLRDGERQQLAFNSERLLARKVPAGSRLVLTLEVIKRADRQINYGGGGDVSAETLADVYKHLRVRWYGGSYIEVPVRR